MRVPYLILAFQALVILCDWLVTRLRHEGPERPIDIGR
jgi:hypothetical protein